MRTETAQGYPAVRIETAQGWLCCENRNSTKLTLLWEHKQHKANSAVRTQTAQGSTRLTLLWEHKQHMANPAVRTETATPPLTPPKNNNTQTAQSSPLSKWAVRTKRDRCTQWRPTSDCPKFPLVQGPWKTTHKKENWSSHRTWCAVWFRQADWAMSSKTDWALSSVRIPHTSDTWKQTNPGSLQTTALKHRLPRVKKKDIWLQSWIFLANSDSTHLTQILNSCSAESRSREDNPESLPSNCRRKSPVLVAAMETTFSPTWLSASSRACKHVTPQGHLFLIHLVHHFFIFLFYHFAFNQ